MGGKYCSSKSKFATRCGGKEIGPRVCLRVSSVCRSHREGISVSCHCHLGCRCYYQRSQEKNAVLKRQNTTIKVVPSEVAVVCRRIQISKWPQSECVLYACGSPTRSKASRRVSREMVAAGPTAKLLSQTQSHEYQYGRKGT